MPFRNHPPGRPNETRCPPRNRACLLYTSKVKVKAISHITGGGFYENIPRSLKSGLTAKIDKNSLPVLPIFPLIQEAGGIPERDMFNTFNMGVGMIICVSRTDADKAVASLKGSGEDARVIGELVAGDEGVVIC